MKQNILEQRVGRKFFDKGCWRWHGDGFACRDGLTINGIDFWVVIVSKPETLEVRISLIANEANRREQVFSGNERYGECVRWIVGNAISWSEEINKKLEPFREAYDEYERILRG